MRWAISCCAWWPSGAEAERTAQIGALLREADRTELEHTIVRADGVEAALKLKPDFSEALIQLATIDIREKALDRALARVEKQISLAPKSAALQQVLGGVFVARGEGEKAEAAFSRAIELEPNSLGAFLQLAELYGQSRRYEEALAKYTNDGGNHVTIVVRAAPVVTTS